MIINALKPLFDIICQTQLVDVISEAFLRNFVEIRESIVQLRKKHNYDIFLMNIKY